MRVDGPELPLATAPLDVETADFAAVISTWLPLSFALNAINQSMGHADLYPYLLPPPVLDKLSYVHDTVVTSVASNA